MPALYPIIHLLKDEDDVIMAPVLLVTYTPVMDVVTEQSRHVIRAELSICHLFSGREPLRCRKTERSRLSDSYKIATGSFLP